MLQIFPIAMCILLLFPKRLCDLGSKKSNNYGDTKILSLENCPLPREFLIYKLYVHVLVLFLSVISAHSGPGLQGSDFSRIAELGSQALPGGGEGASSAHLSPNFL